MSVLTANEILDNEAVIARVAANLNQDGHLGDLNEKQLLRLHQLESLPTTLVKVSSKRERWAEVNDNQAIEEHEGNPWSILDKHVNWDDYRNNQVPKEFCLVYRRTTITFYDKEGVKNLLVLATDEDNFQKNQWAYWFKQQERVSVEFMTNHEDASDSTQILAFIGTKDEAFAFARRMEPANFHEFTDADCMSFAGGKAFRDGGRPWVGELGELLMFVQSYDF